MFVVITQFDCGEKNRLTYFLMSDANILDFIYSETSIHYMCRRFLIFGCFS